MTTCILIYIHTHIRTYIHTHTHTHTHTQSPAYGLKSPDSEVKSVPVNVGLKKEVPLAPVIPPLTPTFTPGIDAVSAWIKRFCKNILYINYLPPSFQLIY